jgi:hypothetical protein
MTGRISEHIRSNMVGYLALFVALGGTAYAAGTVNSGDVVNDSLKSADLKNGRAVKSADVRDDGLGGTDIDEASLEGVDAATLDGMSRLEYVFRSGITTAPAGRENALVFYSYDMVTPEAGSDYGIGQVKLRTTAVAQEFQVCGATGLSDPVSYVLYIEGDRTEDSVAGDGCDAAVNFGDTCDFEVSASGARAWGSQTLPAGNTCKLLALHSS